MTIRRSTPLLLIALVLAVALGSVGTATAGGLTKGAVKRIAAKVVAHKAAGLSVSHATTATTATLLSGSSNTDLKTKQYQYILPAQAAAGVRNYTFPNLPTGNYLVSYQVVAQVNPAGQYLICSFLQPSAPGTFVGLQYGAPAGFGNLSSDSATTFVTGSSQLAFNCNGNGGPASGSFAFLANNANTVTFTPVDIPISGSVTVSRPSAGEAGSAGGLH